MKQYQKGKARTRNEAISWQQNFNKNNYSFAELAQWSEYFTKLAKRYGLIKEFHENGII